MAKKMYAEGVRNGQVVNLVIRAKTEKEARTKIESFPEYRGVEVVDVSPYPPLKF